MDARAAGVTLLSNVADVMGGATGGALVGVAATGAASLGGPVGVGIAIALCAGAIVTQSYLQAKTDGDAQREAEARFARLVDEHGTIRKALQAIAAEQDAHQIFSDERARHMLRLIEQGATADQTQEHLLVYIGDRLGRWCEEHGQSMEVFQRKMENEVSHVRGGIDSILAGQNQQMAMLEQIVTQLRRDASPAIPAVRFDAQLDAVKGLLERYEYDIAFDRLDQLRANSWGQLSPREKFRVLVAMAQIRERRDEDIQGATELYFEATKVDSSHEDAPGYVALVHAQRDHIPEATAAAEHAIKQSPQSALSWAMWIQLAPTGRSGEELLAGVPEQLRTDLDVIYSVARRAMRVDDLATAERYLRRTLELKPDSRNATGELGAVVLEQERRATVELSVGDDAVVHSRDRLVEAESLLTKALQSLGRKGSPAQIANLHRARYTARWLLGQREEARADALAAAEAEPNNPGSILHRAIVLRDDDRDDAAIASLRAVPDEEVPPHSKLFLSKLFARRNKTGDRAEAMSILQGLLRANTLEQPWQRLDAVETLTKLTAGERGTGAAIELLASLPGGTVSDAAAQALRGMVYLRAGHRDEGVAAAQAAAGAVDDEPLRDGKYMIGAVALDAGLKPEAFGILKSVLPADAVVSDTPELMQLALDLGEDQFVLDFCRGLRGRGVFDARFVGAEADLLMRYSAPDRAIAVMQEYLARAPEELDTRTIRAKLTIYGHDLGRSELIERDPKRLPAVTEAGPVRGELTVLALSASDRCRAFEYAYELVRRHFDRPEAHRALIRFMHGGGDLGVTHPEVAGPGAGIVYKDATTGAEDFRIIETGPSPRADRGEVASTHPFAAGVMGKRVGDEFVIDQHSIQTRNGTVLAIMDRRVRRMQDCAARYRERFQEQPFFIDAFTSDPARPEDAVKGILKSIDDKVAFVERVDALVSEKGMPMCMFASILGGTAAQAVTHFADHPSIRVAPWSGTEADIQRAEHDAAATTALVIDPMALSVLYLSKAYRGIRRGNIPLIVSGGTAAEYRREFITIAEFGPQGWIGKENGRYTWVDADPASHQKRLAELGDFLTWIDTTLQVEDGLALARLGPDEREKLVDSVGRPTMESLLLGTAPGRVLWTDDARLAQFGKGTYSLKTIWSQAAIRALINRGQSDTKAVEALAAWLLRSRFIFSQASRYTVGHAAGECGWDPSKHPLKGVLYAVFSSGDFNFDGRLGLAGQSVRQVWLDAPTIQDAARVTHGMLDAIAIGRSGGRIIKMIRDGVWELFPEDATRAIQLRFTIDRWAGRGY